METVQEHAIDSLASLEDRITRAVQVITELRSQNASLSKRVAVLEDEVKAGNETRQELESNNAALLKERDELDQLSKQQAHDLGEMRGERKEVRTRIEKLLSQLDLLSAS
jgi:chromosome segregation ATPase